MTTMLCRNMFDIRPFHFHNQFVQLPFHAHKQFVQLQFHSRTAFSSFAITRVQTDSLFADLASTKFNMSEDDIARILKLAPKLEDLETLDDVEQFIDIFKKRGCTDDQIAMLMRTRPLIMSLSLNNLEAKIRLLADSGFEGQTLMKLLTVNPGILSLDLEKVFLPTMAFLKSIYEPKDVLVKTLLGEPRLLDWDLEKVLKPSLAFWEENGFIKEELSTVLSRTPRLLLRTSLKPAEADFIQNIGLDKGSAVFKYILLTVSTKRLKTLKARIKYLKSRGLSAEEIWQVLRVAPQVLNSTKKVIGAKMNFLVNDLRAPANSVVKHPIFLVKNLEQTMRPRFLVWQKIESTGGLDLSVLDVLCMTERRFIKVIEEHTDSETLRTIYENAVSDAHSGSVALRDQAD